MSSGLSSFSAEDQKDLQTFIQSEEAKARVQTQINQFTEMCFDKCAGSGYQPKPACLQNCVARFLDSSIFLLKKLEQQQQNTL